MGLFSQPPITQEKRDMVNFIVKFDSLLTSYVFIDGVELAALYVEDDMIHYYIEPGEHVVLTGTMFSGKKGKGRGELRFNLEEGKKYKFHCKAGLTSDKVWIEEI